MRIEQWFYAVPLRLRSLFRRRRVEQDLDDELQYHLDSKIQEYIAQGLTPEEAHQAALRAMDGLAQKKEECRDARGISAIEHTVQDIRYGWRVLAKSPGFTSVAVLTLALAIGANEVVFGVLNGLILRPRNLPRAQSLYQIERGPYKTPRHSYPDYVDLRDRNRSFDDLIVYDIAEAGLNTGDSASRVWLEMPSGNYFDALGVQPYLGRFFHATDEHGAGSAPYAVLSYAYWHSHFQDDRGVVGRVVELNKHRFTIVGVSPREFHDPFVLSFPDFWIPIVNEEQIKGENYLNARRTRELLMMMGHLKRGVTPARAIADLNSIGASLEKTYPKIDGQMTFAFARPSLMGDFLGPPVRAFVTGLMLLAALILVAACANLGTLFAARTADRAREVALRLALGASGTRVMRQLLTEAVLISTAGGAVGLLGSVWLLRALSLWQPIPKFSLHVPVEPDAGVYIVALVLALVSGVFFGIVPMRQVLRTNPYQIVKSGSIAIVRRRITTRDLLLVVQISICAVLVTSSFVAVRGLVRSLNGSFGILPDGAMLADTNLSMAGYREDRVPAMQRRMLDTVISIPDVQSVALVDWVALGGEGWRVAAVFFDKTTDLGPKSVVAQPSLFKISPEYFHAAGTRLLSGRDITWHDDKNAPRVAVVNEEFARKLFGSVRSAVGHYFKLADGNRVQVVGVVEDGKYNSLTEDQDTAMFFPLLQSPSSETSLVIRSNRDPQQLAAAVRAAIRTLEAGLPVSVATWRNQMDVTLFPARAATVSLGVLGTLGAILSITGIFGMAAYSVSRRLKELGIRIALGARRKEVLQAALGRAIRLLAFGSGAGLLLGIAASRVLSAIVYQATPKDPIVLAGVVLAMACLGLLATWIPAQRALSLDPVALLREE